MRIVLVIAIVVLALVLSSSFETLRFLVLAVPISLAVGFVVLRRHSPGRALITGALATFGIMVSVGLSIAVAIALSGGFEADENCEFICTSSLGGFALAIIFLLMTAIPLAVVGGLISAITSRELVRPKDSTQL